MADYANALPGFLHGGGNYNPLNWKIGGVGIDTKVLGEGGLIDPGKGARTASAGAQAAADAQKQAADLAWQRAQAAIPQIQKQWDPYNALYNKIYGPGSAWGFGGSTMPAGGMTLDQSNHFKNALAAGPPSGGPTYQLPPAAQTSIDLRKSSPMPLNSTAPPINYDSLLSRLNGR